ncbi:NAD(P)-binding protein [Thalassobacillus sp. CUG 92003]|uniref:NAD(P)-binding protein n=1 Tax=Thalassobacillus sp. CUG 92003 TaxID=2736641 RepID=UPI0015E70E17|nr:NAD(P)-binding protein [Thalassobacillus sp. CUG 92003]
MTALPLMVDLTGKTIAIVGGGKVAAKRVRTLQPTKSNVVIISPELDVDLEEFVACSNVTWKNKPFHPDDLKEAHLVVAATDQHEVNESVVHSAPESAWVNDASHAERGNIQFPGYVTRGKLTIAVSTQGASPMLASQIKQDLSEQYDQDYGHYVDFLYECRMLINQSSFSKSERHEVLKRLIEQPPQGSLEQQTVLDWLEHQTSGGSSP